MGDSWEDDDFEVPVVPQPILPKRDAWDDEEVSHSVLDASVLLGMLRALTPFRIFVAGGRS